MVFFIPTSLLSQGNWLPVRRADFEFGLAKIIFTDEENGYMLGNHDELVITRDGGETWKKYDWIASGIEYLNSYIRDICFTSQDTGWIVGDEGALLRTTDGGRHWTLFQQDVEYHFNSCSFTDNNNGTIAGFAGIILRTFDGGKTWNRQNAPANILLYSVCFIDSSTGWCVGQQGTIWATSDAGLTWKTQNSTVNNSITCIFFLNHLNGWAVGSSSTVLHTTDGGESWEKIKMSTAHDFILDQIYFIDDSTGWIVGGRGYSGESAILLQTTNGGLNWHSIKVPTLNHLSAIAFKNQQQGFIAGLFGTLLKTENGGKSWTSAVSAGNNNINKIFFTSIDSGWAIGKATLIYTCDGGTTWSRIDSLSGNDIFFTDRNNGWFVHAGKGIFHTQDAGKTWRQQIFITHYYKIFFHDSTRGWALGTDPDGANILRTTDGGKTWDDRYSQDYGYWWADIFFTDVNHGWVAGLYGAIDRWEGTVDVDPRHAPQQPQMFTLYPAYPNPFSIYTGQPGTTMEYDLNATGMVKIEIYNIRGQRIRRFSPGRQHSGRHTVVWDGRNTAGMPVAAGVYIYRIYAGDQMAGGKLCVLR